VKEEDHPMNEPRATPGANPSPNAADGVSGANDAATTVLEDLESLRSRASERDQFLQLLKRTQADFENYQKRNQREREQERHYWHGSMGLDLLPVLDNLHRATAAASQAGETGPLVQGVGMVLNQLVDLLRRHGITPIDAQGKPFDPNLHQAVMQQPTNEVPPGHVAAVLEQGFMIHDRVLRPARVTVAVPGKTLENAAADAN
jgi:molecular chaperone GrpE